MASSFDIFLQYILKNYYLWKRLNTIMNTYYIKWTNKCLINDGMQ